MGDAGRLHPDYAQGSYGQLSRVAKWKAKMHRLKLKKTYFGDAFEPISLLTDDKDFALLREPYTEEFLLTFGMAFQNYYLGEWVAARTQLEKTQAMLGFEDTPS